VRREQSAHDARAYNAVVTGAGLARLHRALAVRPYKGCSRREERGRVTVEGVR
jgi:hypothetical protein